MLGSTDSSGLVALLVRVARMRLSLAIVAVGLGAWFGLPCVLNLTLPWSELGRARPAAWEVGAWASVVLVLALAEQRGAAPANAAWIRWSRRAALVGALATLGYTQVQPTKWTVNIVQPATPGVMATPRLGASGPTQVLWSRALLEGPAWRLAPDVVANDLVLMGIAGGIQQSAAVDRQTTGGGSGVVTGAQDRVRRALWAVQRLVTSVVVYGRVGLLAIAPVLFGFVARGRGTPAVLRWGVRVLAWGVPSANLLSLAVCTASWLPDDVEMRLSAWLITVVHLGVVWLADRAGRT